MLKSKSGRSGVMTLAQEALKIHSSDNDDRSDIQNADISAHNMREDNVISMAHIFRAEDNLGHTVISPKDVENAHIGHTDSVVLHLFKTIKNYSLDDTKTEQNGGPSDQDLTTAGGFLKQGIQDPDAHEGKKIQKRAEIDLRRLSMQMEEASITAMLAELDEKIAESKAKIADLEEHMKDISDLQSMIDDGVDLNGNSQDSRGARRKAIKILSTYGKSIEDYTGPNEKIDTDRLTADLNSMGSSAKTGLHTLREELETLEAQRQDLRQQQISEANGSTQNVEVTKELAQGIANNEARASLSSEEEDIALVQENITANSSAPDEGMGLMAMFGFTDDSETINAEVQLSQNQDIATSEITEDTSTLSAANNVQERTSERSFGSFAQSSDDQSPIASIAQNITAMFSQVTNTETPSEAPAQQTAEATEDYAQQGWETKQSALTA